MRLNSLFYLSASLISAACLSTIGCSIKESKDIDLISTQGEVPVELLRTIPENRVGISKIIPKQSSNNASKFFAFFGNKLPAKFYDDFCNKNPQECSGGLTAPGALEFNENGKNILVYVNEYVNRRMTYQIDEDSSSEWTLPIIVDEHGVVGDCEEYALLKRSILRDFIPDKSMFLVALSTETGGNHIVLAVRTTEGDMLLDNRFPEVLKADKMPKSHGYKYMLATKPGNPKDWFYVYLPEDDFDERLKKEYSTASHKVTDESIVIASMMRNDPSSQVAQRIIGVSPALAAW